MSEIDKNKLADLILKTLKRKLFRLPPALKKKEQLLNALDFFFKYYGTEKEYTLKNAASFFPKEKMGLSKVHIWLSHLAYAIRITLIKEYCKNNSIDNSVLKTRKIFRNKLPQCPLVMKSDAGKYKFISVNKWTDSMFDYVSAKEIGNILTSGELPVFAERDFKQKIQKKEIIESIQNLIDTSEVLDKQGNYGLSDKIINSTELITQKLGLYNEKF